MFKKRLLTISFFVFLASNVNAGIITMVKVPENVQKILTHVQDQVKKQFEELNNSIKDTGRSYEFDIADNAPESFHISLLYIADKGQDGQ